MENQSDKGTTSECALRPKLAGNLLRLNEDATGQDGTRPSGSTTDKTDEPAVLGLDCCHQGAVGVKNMAYKIKHCEGRSTDSPASDLTPALERLLKTHLGNPLTLWAHPSMKHISCSKLYTMVFWTKPLGFCPQWPRSGPCERSANHLGRPFSDRCALPSFSAFKKAYSATSKRMGYLSCSGTPMSFGPVSRHGVISGGISSLPLDLTSAARQDMSCGSTDGFHSLALTIFGLFGHNIVSQQRC